MSLLLHLFFKKSGPSRRSRGMKTSYRQRFELSTSHAIPARSPASLPPSRQTAQEKNVFRFSISAFPKKVLSRLTFSFTFCPLSIGEVLEVHTSLRYSLVKDKNDFPISFYQSVYKKLNKAIIIRVKNGY